MSSTAAHGGVNAVARDGDSDGGAHKSQCVCAAEVAGERSSCAASNSGRATDKAAMSSIAAAHNDSVAVHDDANAANYGEGGSGGVCDGQRAHAVGTADEQQASTVRSSSGKTDKSAEGSTAAVHREMAGVPAKRRRERGATMPPTPASTDGARDAKRNLRVMSQVSQPRVVQKAACGQTACSRNVDGALRRVSGRAGRGAGAGASARDTDGVGDAAYPCGAAGGAATASSSLRLDGSETSQHQGRQSVDCEMNDWLGDGDIFSEWVHDVTVADVASGHAERSGARSRPAADDVDGRMARSDPNDRMSRGRKRRNSTSRWDGGAGLPGVAGGQADVGGREPALKRGREGDTT